MRGSFGVTVYTSNDIYIGNFDSEQNPDGIAIVKTADNGQFKGEVFSSRISGYGEFVSSSNVRYKGEWIEESPDGYGIETWNDGSTFTGFFQDGQKKLGKFTWPDGSTYEGEFNRNNMEGFGIYTFPDKKVFSGEWKNGQLNGFVRMEWKDGKKYIGNCDRDKKEGFGILQTINPMKIFLGFWKNNKQEGVGKVATDKSEKYGFWTGGERLNWFNSEREAVTNLPVERSSYEKILRMSTKELIKLIS